MIWRILIIPLMAIFSSCTSIATNTSFQDQQLAEATPAATLFVRDGKGNVINATGWQIPVLPPNRKYEPAVLRTGETGMKGLMFRFVPEEKMIVTIPKYWQDGEVSYAVTRILERKGKDQPPYCYEFIVTPNWPDPGKSLAITTFFSYRDDDGDGIFETLGRDCATPAWVK